MSFRRFVWLAGLGVVVLLALGLCTILPYLVPLFLTFWLVGLAADIYSTWRMYLLEPGKFPENESNVFFVPLYKRFGFKKSIPPFLALVEFPRLVFVALVCTPLVGAWLGLESSPLVGLGVATAAQGYVHLCAWRVNNCFVGAKKGPADVY